MKPGRPDTPPGSPEPRRLGALMALVEQEQLAQAEREARALLELHPGAGLLWKVLGVVQLRLGADALPALAQAASLLPTDAEAQGNLGAALHDLGRWHEARAFLERALTLNPRLHEAHRQLAAACLALGDFTAGIGALRAALALDPADAETATRLGNALRDAGDLRAAAAAHAHAIALAPQSAESHANLGHVLVELRRLDEAAASYRQALTLRPDHPAAHVSLGTVLRLQGRADEAFACCRAALASAADDVDAWCLQGELLADSGRFTEAEQAFARTLSIDPDFAFGYFGIASLRKMTSGDSAWLQGAQRLLAKPQPLRHEISLRYALGKHYDDVALYPTAFGHFQRANELSKRFGRRYDRGEMERRVDAAIADFPAQALQALRRHGRESQRPLFVVGMPRSGTTLVEQILASHESIHGAGELTYWQAAAGTLNAAERAEPGRGMSGRLAQLAQAYLDRLEALAPQAARVVDKMPANFLHLGLIHAALPGARIVHLRRDPRDTCLSIYFQHFSAIHPYANDLGDLAHHYREYARLMAHWRRVLPAEAFLEIPYEELVADQEGWSRRLIAFAGLPWDPRCLEFHRTRRVVITTSKWQVRQKIHASSAGRWRNYAPFLGPLQGLMDLPELT